MNWRVYLLDLLLIAAAVLLANLTLLQESGTDWQTWGKALGFAFLSRSLPETMTFLGALRNRWSTADAR